MLNMTEVVQTFPSATIKPKTNGLPIEVSLIAQLGHGAGNHLFASVASRQSKHAEFIDELDEPSAKLSGTNLELGDPSSLYSFVVGPKGHPFHKHAGNRIFTAVSGSGGAQLRFSTATTEAMNKDPQSFFDELQYINIPPDCLFTVRFGGETWHQFWPLSRNSLHPVFFALSCHTNELGGNLSEELKEQVVANDATIPSLTELLPSNVSDIFYSDKFNDQDVPTIKLSLDAPEGTIHRFVCNTVRSNMGKIRGLWGDIYKSSGYLSQSISHKNVKEQKAIPEGLLLREHLEDCHIHHEDVFSLSFPRDEAEQAGASEILENVLEGFLLNAPRGVSRLMSIRNILVKPLGLRTSPLGCPVSSLLSDKMQNLFANKYPVLDQKTDDKDQFSQVILGADDKHLKFRSCVAVKSTDENKVDIYLATRVHCKNLFGRLYMALIAQVHKRYISPMMLSKAADYALSQVKEQQ